MRMAKRSSSGAVPLESRQGHAVGELISQPGSPIAAKRRRSEVGVARRWHLRAGNREPKSGRVWAPNIPGWDDYPLKAEIKRPFPIRREGLSIDSDRSASILGEAWQGAARDCRNAIFLAVGTGIGAGILVDGRVLHGAHGIAGAIGWLALDRPFRPEYAGCGCFESHASGEGIAKMRAKRVLGATKTIAARCEMQRRLTAHDVFAAYEQGDEVAKEVFAQAIEFWGMASANLISLFNPEKIVFGGGVFGPATQFLDAIAAEARRWAQPIAFERVDVRGVATGRRCGTVWRGILGAACGATARTAGTARRS